MRLVVLCPHFAPDVAPTGEVITRIVEELAARGHAIEVITALPWYEHHAVEPEFRGKAVRRETTPWGEIVRVHPFPTDKRDIPRRALAFGGFSALAGAVGVTGGRVDGVLAMSPPLTLGLTGWGLALARRAPLVFNIQDVFPDVAIELGVLTRRARDRRGPSARAGELRGGRRRDRAVRRPQGQRRRKGAAQPAPPRCT